MKKYTVGIVGYGQFGRFLGKHLRPYATILPIKRDTPGATLTRCDIIIYAVPFGGLELAITTTKPHIRTDALIVDVTSVKQKPLMLMAKYFPHHPRLGTHPIFGPQSGKNGIEGLPIVLCRENTPLPVYRRIKTFLKLTLKLKVIEQTAKEHDAQMARIQALTHFIGRALLSLSIKSYTTNTKSYQHLINLTKLLQFDSWELFTTIQNSNPEAKVVRKEFMKSLQQLEKDLG